MNVPACTISSLSRSYSACEPSHQCTLSGLHSAAHSSTHASSVAFFVRSRSATVIVRPSHFVERSARRSDHLQHQQLADECSNSKELSRSLESYPAFWLILGPA